MPCPARHLMTLLVCGLALLACGSDAADGASELDATDTPAADTGSDDDGQAAPDAVSSDDGMAVPDAVSDDDGQAAPDTTSSDDGLAEPDAASDDDGLAETDDASDDDGLAAPDAPCSADCEGKQCGDDGCGGDCGTCGDGLQCDEVGQCVCAPDCDGKDCGPDGCGGVCGEPFFEGNCGSDATCDESGQCECSMCQTWDPDGGCYAVSDYGPYCTGTTVTECYEGEDHSFDCPNGCDADDVEGWCLSLCGDGVCEGGPVYEPWEHPGECPEDCPCEEDPDFLAGCEEGSCAFTSSLGDGTCDAVFDCAEHDHDGGDCEAPPPGCEPTGPGQYVQEVQVVPASPTDCTETSIVLSGVHPGLNYDFGTTNTGVCQPPFGCGASEAIVTLNLTATVHSDNPPGPDYEATFDLGTLEAYTYCVRVLYGASQGVSEEIKTSLTVQACD